MKFQQFTGGNCDKYTGSGEIWRIAAEFNKESEMHIFDRFGEKLTKKSFDSGGNPEIVAMCSQSEMKNKQCMKRKTLNVTRRKVNADEYEPVGVL